MDVSVSPITATYDYRLVGLSIVIAILASYVALDLAERVRRGRASRRLLWLCGGALAMGTGIWSMHYTGMLAYRLPIEMYYHLPTVVLSLVLAVLASLVAFVVISRPFLTSWHIAAGSLLMGTGIVSMHYVGMMAMRMHALEHYSTGWVLISIALGLAVSWAAIRLSTLAGHGQQRWSFKVISCVVMGLAIPLVHYSGMAAVTLTRSDMAHHLGGGIHISVVANYAIILITLIVLGATALTSGIDRWLSGQAEEMLRLREEAEDAIAQKEQMFRELVEASPDAIIVHDGTRILFVNPASVSLFRAGSAHELVGQHLAERIHPDHRDNIRKLIEERERTGVASPPGEHVLVAFDGSLIQVEAVGIPFLWDDAPAHEVVLRDISQRKRAEKALLEWNERHQLAQRAGLQLGWWEWDMTSGRVIWSDEVYRQFGYTRENFGGRIEDFFRRLHPEDRPRVEKLAHDITMGSGDYASQFRVLRPDATMRWIDCRGVVVRDGGARMIGITIDITDAKAGERSLRESEEKYRLLLNSTAEAIYGIDLYGKCTFCNPACLRLLGYDHAEELLGRNMHEVMHHTRSDGTPYPVHECSIYRAIRSGTESHIVGEVFWRKDASSFDAEYWSYPMRQGGKLVGSVVTFLDVSERKRAEDAQSRSEQLFRLIAENSADLIAVVDRAGKRIYNNPAYWRILGYAPEELKKTVAFEQIHPDDREMVKRTAQEALQTGVGKMIEYRMQRRDGTYVNLESHGSVIRNPRGEIEAQVISARDVGARKLAAQAEKLSAIGQLAAGIAHEINTPVQYLSDNVSFLRDSWSQVEVMMAARASAAAGANSTDSGQASTNPQAEEWAFLQKEIPGAISQSLEGIRRISKIVGAMRKFSHSGGGEKALVDINDALETTLTVAYNELKHIADVTTQFQADLPRVECLPDEMNQVFLNLIVNASHAMRELAQAEPPRRGKLTVTTRLVEEAVQIEIQDNGSGIPEHIRSRVFEPFFTTKQVGEGTGQGLAICHDIVVNKHRGKIWFDTESGKGTTFSLRLPLKFDDKGGNEK